MISISFSDLQLISQLSHLSEYEMLKVERDNLINSYLEQLGFDLEFGIAYLPSKHRNLRNQVVMGFRAVGEVSINKAFVNGPFATLADRLVAYAYTDRSWVEELAELSGKVRDVAGNADIGLFPTQEDRANDFPESQLEDDYVKTRKEIKRLEDLREELRGSMFSANGSLKTSNEYKQDKGNDA